MHYGRYVWVYTIAPVVGGVLAGLMYKKHVAAEESEGSDGEKKQTFVEN